LKFQNDNKTIVLINFRKFVTYSVQIIKKFRFGALRDYPVGVVRQDSSVNVNDNSFLPSRQVKFQEMPQVAELTVAS
jgi:hypothetical protein